MTGTEPQNEGMVVSPADGVLIGPLILLGLENGKGTVVFLLVLGKGLREVGQFESVVVEGTVLTDTD
jgi:hypothetical protein